MCDQREGNLRKLGVEEIAEDLRFKVVESSSRENSLVLFSSFVCFVVQCVNSLCFCFISMLVWKMICLAILSLKNFASSKMSLDVIFFKLILRCYF